MKIDNKLKALEDHLDDPRQMHDCSDYDAENYFASHLLLQRNTYMLTASNGAIIDEQDEVDNVLRTEVRVGSYDFDGRGSAITSQIPSSDNYLAMRNALWDVTWAAFNEAQDEYLEKQETLIDSDQPMRVKSFAEVEPVQYSGKIVKRPRMNMSAWKSFMRESSSLARDYPDIEFSGLDFEVQEVVRMYANSEGTRTVQQDFYYRLVMKASTIIPDDGGCVGLDKRYLAQKFSEFPTKAELMDAYSSILEDVRALKKAPVERAGYYPAMFDPANTEVLFHEIVGHRLEGERQDSDWEGDTFQDKIGKRIAPEFVSLIDDPTIDIYTDSNGKKQVLLGFYRFDDEGVPAQRVLLIEDGILRNYLTSRTPVEGYETEPNGHGRTEGEEDPIARMSNLIVTTNNPLSRPELERMLLAECDRQNRPYGLLFEGSSGGYTVTEEDYFRIFPKKMYRVWARDSKDPDTGIEFRRGDRQLVRGVGVTGTPLTILNNIIGMGKDNQVWPGFCGAESGLVKVSGVAPSSVFSRIEVKADEIVDLPNPNPKPSSYLAGEWCEDEEE